MEHIRVLRNARAQSETIWGTHYVRDDLPQRTHLWVPDFANEVSCWVHPMARFSVTNQNRPDKVDNSVSRTFSSQPILDPPRPAERVSGYAGGTASLADHLDRSSLVP